MKYLSDTLEEESEEQARLFLRRHIVFGKLKIILEVLQMNAKLFRRRFMVCVLSFFLASSQVLFLTGVVIAQTDIQEAETAFGRSEFERELLLMMEIPIVFAAAKYEQLVSDAPSFVTIITADDIQKYGYNTLADALRSVAGMFVTNDRHYEYLGVRGFFRTGDYISRILVLIDGHPTNDNIYSSASIGTDLEISMDMVKRIEVVRGSGSALYGTSAIFGVINIVTKTGENLDGLKISLRGGSYEKKIGNFSYGGKYENGLEVTASGSFTDTEGAKLYFEEFKDTPDGGNVNHDYDKYYTLLGNISFANFALNARAYSREKGIPTAPWETIFADNRQRTVDRGIGVESKYAHKIDNNKSIMGRIYYDYYKEDGIYPYDDPDYPVSKEENIGKWYGSELQFDWEQFQRNRLMVGFEYQNSPKSEISSWNEEDDGTLIYEYPTIDKPHELWAFYLQDELKATEDLSFTLGVHYDHYPTFGGATNPRVAAVYKPFYGSVIKLLYGEGFKAPNIYELYYTDEGETMVENEDLEPEKVNTYEAGLEQNIGASLWGRISIYHIDVRDLITQVDTEPDPVEQLLQFQNMGDATINGLELELKGTLKHGSKGYLNFAYQDANDKETKEELINVPKLTGNLGISISILRDKVYASLEGHYLGKRLTKEEGVEVDPYFVANLTLLAKNLFRNLEMSVSIYNLLDEEYEDPAGEEHLQVKIPQNGRNFLITANYNF